MLDMKNASEAVGIVVAMVIFMAVLWLSGSCAGELPGSCAGVWSGCV